MYKYKGKIIVVVAIIAALAVAWLYGGRYPDSASAEAAIPSGVERVAAPDLTEVSVVGMDPITSKDKYLTESVPEGRPVPVEPQDTMVGDDSFTVTLVVRCNTIPYNSKLLDNEKWELVPEDGVIYPMTEIVAYEGESVFNILHREMKRAQIHLTFRNTPVYNSAYIEAINNLYEFDVGELSGWMYCVNGWYPNYGCSRYQVKPGDVIEWMYTCDLGRDLGQDWLFVSGQHELDR